jgi:hypothetical protein
MFHTVDDCTAPGCARHGEMHRNLALAAKQQTQLADILVMGMPEGNDLLQHSLRDTGVAHRPIWRVGRTRQAPRHAR